MARIELQTEIHAPRERCFDLSRDLDLHLRSMAHTSEQAVAGVTSGLIGPDEEVTWRARHFGVTHHHTSRITGFDRPSHFRDEMVRGRFASFVHDHFFEPTPSGTRMLDVIVFRSPLGIVGRLVDAVVLQRYLARLIQERNALIKREAERGPG